MRLSSVAKMTADMEVVDVKEDTTITIRTDMDLATSRATNAYHNARGSAARPSSHACMLLSISSLVWTEVYSTRVLIYVPSIRRAASFTVVFIIATTTSNRASFNGVQRVQDFSGFLFAKPGPPFQSEGRVHVRASFGGVES